MDASCRSVRPLNKIYLKSVNLPLAECVNDFEAAGVSFMQTPLVDQDALLFPAPSWKT
jgi:hypothetical protein